VSKHNDFENDILSLFYTATAVANLADNAASAPFTNIYIALHTGDPGEAGTQATSEAAYTGYARVPVARTTGGWTVSSGICDNDAAITFGQSSDGPESETYFSSGTVSSGATKILHSGALDATLVVNSGITPEFAPGDCNFTED